MQRTTSIDAVSSLPAPLTPAGPAGFYNQTTNPVLATTLTPDAVNSLQEEICSVIAAADITLDVTQNNQMLTAINDLIATAVATKALLSGSTSQTFSVANAATAHEAVALGQFSFTNYGGGETWSIRPDGLIEQTFPAGVAAINGTQTTTFGIPHPFPSACIDCTVCFAGGDPPSPGSVAIALYDNANVSITTFAGSSATFGCFVRCRGY